MPTETPRSVRDRGQRAVSRPAAVDWRLPAGPHGLLARTLGPGATRGELGLQFGSALAAAFALPAAAIWAEWGWSEAQLIVSALLAFDLVGGVVTNATNAGKRWHHRPGRTGWTHMRFVLIHLHPFLVVWLFGSDEWLFATVCYAFVLAAAGVILITPLHLRRPVAMLAFLLALLLAIYGPGAPENTEWFFPIFAMKLLVAYAVREEPYRPSPEALPVSQEPAHSSTSSER